MTSIRTTICAVLVAGLAIPAASQHVETLDVRVIQVPVLVYRGAEPVRGLTRDDFELIVNGKRAPIAYFDVLEFGENRSTGAEAVPPRDQRRLTMIVFDASPMDLLRARPAVERLVGMGGAGEFFAIGMYDGREIRYLTNFTRDRRALVRALATMEPSAARDPFALAITVQERSAVADPSASRSAEAGGFSDELFTEIEDFERAITSSRTDRGTMARAEAGMRRHQEWLEQIEAESWASALTAIADDLVPLEGIKQVILVSGAASLGLPRTNVIGNLHRSFRRAGATLHVVDLNGLRAPGNASSRGPSANYRTPDILFRAALGTGGRVIATGPEVAARILSRTSSITYLLGFRPPSSERDGWNDIAIKVKSQPWFTSVSHRKGYAAGSAAVRSVGNVFLADAMLHDLPVSELTVTILAPGEGVIEVGVPSDELLEWAIDDRMTVDFYIYIFDAAGEVAGWRQRRMRIDASAARSALRGAELVRRERFAIPSGRFTAKALVHIVERGMLGFRRLEFDVELPPRDEGLVSERSKE